MSESNARDYIRAEVFVAPAACASAVAAPDVVYDYAIALGPTARPVDLHDASRDLVARDVGRREGVGVRHAAVNRLEIAEAQAADLDLELGHSREAATAVRPSGA